jgi:hypothetical protein
MPPEDQFDEVIVMSNNKSLADYFLVNNARLELRKKGLPKLGPIYCKTENGLQVSK